MTALRLAVALLAAGLSTPAMARTQAQLDCAIQRAPAGLGDSIAAAMVAGDRAAMRPLQQRLEVVVRQCVTAQRMRDAEAENYYDYALARLPGEALSRQLGRAGIATARLDAVLGYRALANKAYYLYLCLGIVAYGALMEIGQSWIPGRQMSAYDFLANTLGVVLGAAVAARKR